MKKEFLATAMILVLSFTAAVGQHPVSGEDFSAPDLQIIKFSWRGGRPDTNIGSGGAFSVEVKNISQKQIAAVDWEYILIDSVRDSVYDLLKFRTDDKPLAPGQTKKFTKRIEYQTLPKYIKAVPRIMRVEFTDGTFWQRKLEQLDSQ